jgi:periplasmic mercuric ion binding protein
MKTLKTISASVLVFLFFAVNGFAQSGLKEISIKTSAVCDMCKSTIEKNLAFEKGVKRSVLDVKTKIVTVTYNPEKTDPGKIRQAIAKSGYDADDVRADAKAYNKLDSCCKKGAECKDKK